VTLVQPPPLPPPPLLAPLSFLLPMAPTTIRPGHSENHRQNYPNKTGSSATSSSFFPDKLTPSTLANLLYQITKFLFLLYYFISLSFRLSFVQQFSYSTSGAILGSLVVDYLVDIFFLIDYISYEYQHYGIHTVVPVDNVAESAEIVSIDFMRNARRNSASSLGEFYVTTSSPLHPSRLIFEIICLFPMELVGFLVGYKHFTWLRLNRFLRIFNGFTYWSNIIQALEQCGFQTQSGWSRIALSCIFQTVVCHVAGCAYYCLALFTMEKGHHEKTWLSHDNSLMFDENNEVVYLRQKDHIYIRAIYWSAQTLVCPLPSPPSTSSLCPLRKLLASVIFQLTMQENQSSRSSMSTSLDSRHKSPFQMSS
jgi:hypothetical protein